MIDQRLAILLEESQKPIRELNDALRPHNKKYIQRRNIADNHKILNKFRYDEAGDATLRVAGSNNLWNRQLKEYELIDELLADHRNYGTSDWNNICQQDMLSKLLDRKEPKDELAERFRYALTEAMSMFLPYEYAEIEKEMLSTKIPLLLFQRKMPAEDYFEYLESRKPILKLEGKDYFLNDFMNHREEKEQRQKKGLLQRLFA